MQCKATQCHLIQYDTFACNTLHTLTYTHVACLHVWPCLAIFLFSYLCTCARFFSFALQPVFKSNFSYVCSLCHFDMFINWCICISMHFNFVVFMQSKLRMFVSTDIHILTCRNIYVCIHGPHMFTFKSM